MPVSGGAPTRLTYDPSGAEMVDWTPDGKRILFRSRRDVPMVGYRLYTIPATGGLPTPLPMEKAAYGAFAPDGNRLAFSQLSREGNPWKRYRGGQANRIWIADLAQKTFHRINDDTINEQFPQWIGEAIYYLSEHDGSANLWRYDVKSKRSVRVTSHDSYDVNPPGTDGKRLIYEQGGDLWLYDTHSGKEQKVKMALTSDRIHARPLSLPAIPQEFALGPTGKRLVVQTRGQIATLGVEKGESRPIATLLGSRAQNVTWSPDGKWIAFVSDRSGEQNIWIAPAGGQGESRQITSEAKLQLSNLAWSPDSRHIAFTDNALALWLLDVNAKTKTLVKRMEYNGDFDFSFAPDGKWLAFSRQENLKVQSLYLYNLAQKQATRLTLPPTRDYNPVFDPGGKFLYFLSERSVQPQGDSFDFQNNFSNATKIYALTLAADTPSPLNEDSDEEPGSLSGPVSPPLTLAIPKPADTKPGETKPTDAAKSTPTLLPAKLPDVKIDLDGIGQRIVEVPVPGGVYRALSALPGKVTYISHEGAPSPSNLPKLKAYDFGGKKEVELGAGVLGYALSADNKKMAVRTPGGIQIADAGMPVATGKAVDTSAFRVEVDPEKEWKQIFEEAWRNHRDTFYDPNLHGQDWEAVRRKYEALLPTLGDRSDLNLLIGEMQGELNVSHEFNGGGFERQTTPYASSIGALGADLAYDATTKAYKIARIFPGDGFDMSARSPLLMPGLKVKPGLYVLTIDGRPLPADTDPSMLLKDKGGKTITLQVNDKPTLEGARLIRIKAMANDSRARYYAWVQKCRDYVTTNGGANLGYLHLPDMGNDGIAEFTKHFYANLDKDGLVIDVRYNHGGIVSGQILERLRRVIFEYDQSRYGKPVPYHYTAYPGRVVILCNEATSSDGEYFCTGARYMKLGPVVGTRTWGGYMAVNNFPTIDGGSVSTPQAGSFTPEGKWLPDGYGFTPDFVVDDDPNAFVADRDPQLDKALELLKAEIKRNPPHFAAQIPPPSKEKAFAPNRK